MSEHKEWSSTFLASQSLNFRSTTNGPTHISENPGIIRIYTLVTDLSVIICTSLTICKLQLRMTDKPIAVTTQI